MILAIVPYYPCGCDRHQARCLGTVAVAELVGVKPLLLSLSSVWPSVPDPAYFLRFASRQGGIGSDEADAYGMFLVHYPITL
jgi:hypothetical protein